LMGEECMILPAQGSSVNNVYLSLLLFRKLVLFSLVYSVLIVVVGSFGLSST